MTPQIYNASNLPSRTINIDGQSYLWFSGTSYLGMPHQADFQQNIIEAIGQYGLSWGSSRNNTVRLAVYEKAENALAHFLGAEAALTVSSGMMAGQLVVQYYKQMGFTPFYAPKTHPALWHLPQMDMSGNHQDWEAQIVSQIEDSSAQNIVIFSDAVASPFVQNFSFDWLNHLPKNKNIVVVIDASHSLGIRALPMSNLENVKTIVSSSLNKAMGMAGGIVLSDNETINQLKAMPFFGGASPMMPALLGAFLKSEAIFSRQKERLLSNIRYFNKQIGATFLSHFTDYPGYCTYQEGFHQYLKSGGVMSACFAYPTAQDLPVTRLSISSLHTQNDLDTLAQLCNSRT